jgi:histidyl-tRNA synthetase
LNNKNYTKETNMPKTTKSLQNNRPRGTLDKLPGEIYKYQYIEKTALETAALYGYREIRTPVFEHTELFKRGVGDTTDVVQKEMYTFDDKKGRSLTLKPEGTACAVRAAIENGLLNDALPLKLCYITNCYRYEAPQSGRYREFSQFGAEVYGAHTPACDVELIALAYDLFNKLGLKDYTIQINSIGCPSCRVKYQETLIEYFAAFKDRLCGDCLNRLQRNPMRLLDCKTDNCRSAIVNCPSILEYNCDSCTDFFDRFKQGLDSLSIPYTVNSRIVRGLDYYTNTVFEFIAESSLVFGAGGRYNGLIEQLGGTPTPASGFALGLERIVCLTQDFPAMRTPDIYIGGLGNVAADFSLALARKLRGIGVWAECDIVGRSVKAQMRFADKIGAKFSLIIGETELSENKAVLKNMQTKETCEVGFNPEEIFEAVFIA